MKADELVGVLRKLALEYRVLENESGGQTIISERGGRVLGIFPDKESGNMLWVQPELESFLQSPEWNIGGERTWMSPEIEYFVGDVHRFFESYTVQPELDPGNYRIDEITGDDDGERMNSATWRQSLELMAFRSNRILGMALEKSCRLIPDPLLGKWNGLAYSFVGYESAMRLQRLNEDVSSIPLALWTIIQVPAGGEVIIPTRGKAEVANFFQPTGSSHLQVSEGEVRFKLDAAEQHKISLKAPYLMGKIGYIRPMERGIASLIVRRFQVHPSGKYADVPMHDHEDYGHCVQSYYDDRQLGSFGELEYHTPVIEPNLQSETVLRDVSQMWCYTGSADAIDAIADYFLRGGENG